MKTLNKSPGPRARWTSANPARPGAPGTGALAMDGKLAVIGLGSIGSMALWQASRLTDSVVGFEAQSPAHGRSAVGGDTRLFRMIYRRHPRPTTPSCERSRDLWAELEAETGQDILTRCGGLSIGTADGPYIRSLLETARTNGAAHEILNREEMAERYPQHNLRPDDCAIYDPNAGALRTDRAVTAAVAAAQANGATVLRTHLWTASPKPTTAWSSPRATTPGPSRRSSSPRAAGPGGLCLTISRRTRKHAGFSCPGSLPATQPSSRRRTSPFSAGCTRAAPCMGHPPSTGSRSRPPLDGRGHRTPRPDSVPRELTDSRNSRRPPRRSRNSSPASSPPSFAPTPSRTSTPGTGTRCWAGSASQAGSIAPQASPGADSRMPPGTATLPRTKRSANSPSKAWNSYARKGLRRAGPIRQPAPQQQSRQPVVCQNVR